MPLTPAVPRKRMHESTARYEGFVRDDELFDIDAHLNDVKEHAAMRSRRRPRSRVAYYPAWYRGVKEQA